MYYTQLCVVFSTS